MIGVIMNVRVKPGTEQQFSALTAQLQANVRANEPGVPFYQVMQQSDDPLNFVFVELFVDDAALAAHPNMPYHQAMSAAGWACVDGEPEIRNFKPVIA